MTPDLRMRWTYVSLSIIVLLASGASAASAAVRNASTTAELESAVAAAQAGDTIVLAPGIYRPSAPLVFTSAVTVQGDPSAPTIIDGSNDAGDNPYHLPSFSGFLVVAIHASRA